MNKKILLFGDIIEETKLLKVVLKDQVSNIVFNII